MYGHNKFYDSLAKSILQGKAEVERKRGTPNNVGSQKSRNAWIKIANCGKSVQVS